MVTQNKSKIELNDLTNPQTPTDLTPEAGSPEISKTDPNKENFTAGKTH